MNKNHMRFFREELEKNAFGNLINLGFGAMSVMDVKSKSDSIKKGITRRPPPLGHFTQYKMQGGKYDDRR